MCPSIDPCESLANREIKQGATVRYFVQPRPTGTHLTKLKQKLTQHEIINTGEFLQTSCTAEAYIYIRLYHDAQQPLRARLRKGVVLEVPLSSPQAQDRNGDVMDRGGGGSWRSIISHLLKEPDSSQSF